MTKHFIEYLLTAAMAVMTAQSCVSKIDPIFDESSANRVEALAERLNETLTGARTAGCLSTTLPPGNTTGDSTCSSPSARATR